jgi:hypothetical protein
MSLMVLLESTASSERLGNPSKVLLGHCNWCYSSSFESDGIGDFNADFNANSTLSELDPTSFAELFFLKSYIGKI